MVVNDVVSSYYQVEYHFEKIDKDITNSDEVFNELKKYNGYIDNIVLTMGTNIKNHSEYKIIDLFDRNGLDKYYNTIEKNGIIIKMNDVLDTYFNILDDDKTKNITYNNFVNGIIIFLNELIKRKIIKTIRLHNSMMLEKNDKIII